MNSADAPHTAHNTIGIVTIQRVSVIEVQTGQQSNLRRGRPLQNLLSPVHPHETMHFTLLYQLKLRSIPQIVMSSSLLQLFLGVNILSLVLSMISQCLLSPISGTLHLVILLVVVAEVVGQLPPD